MNEQLKLPFKEFEDEPKENTGDLSLARKTIREAFDSILQALHSGYGLEYENDENFTDTPDRVARSFLEKNVGINSEALCETILKSTFPSEYDGYIVIDPITVNSICPHHFENVVYTVYFGYMPNGRCVGLSKIPRVVKLFGRQPILQEDYTKKMADLFEKILNPRGMGILVVGKHNCMRCRGLNDPNVQVKTPIMRGEFASIPGMKEEFYRLCNF